jgi:hypothetical protein
MGALISVEFNLLTAAAKEYSSSSVFLISQADGIFYFISNEYSTFKKLFENLVSSLTPKRLVFTPVNVNTVPITLKMIVFKQEKKISKV